MRLLPDAGHQPIGMDNRPGSHTALVGSVADPAAVAIAMADVEAVVHTATLHKPQVASRSRQAFVDVNVTGTLTLLEAARERGAGRFVFTSTTSAFGDALRPAPGGPAVWIDEGVRPIPKNIYGATKCAAEDLCALFARNEGLRVTVLRTARFFPEPDDSAATRDGFADANAKANEFLHRRADIADVARAHILALTRDPPGNFARYVVSAPTPFTRADLPALRTDPAGVVARYFPDFLDTYARAGYRMFDAIDRVYSAAAACEALGWRPEFDFARILTQIAAGEPIGSDLSRAIGIKGYPDSGYGEGIFPDA